MSALETMEECNQILMRLYTINKNQIISMKDGSYQSLDLFTDRRQAVLEMLDIVEDQLDREWDNLKESQKKPMAKEISLRKEVLQNILEQEIDLHRLIESEKNRTMLEIHSTKKNHKVVSAYKSGRVEKKLDKDI